MTNTMMSTFKLITQYFYIIKRAYQIALRLAMRLIMKLHFYKKLQTI